jgi:hypothetical protein
MLRMWGENCRQFYCVSVFRKSNDVLVIFSCYLLLILGCNLFKIYFYGINCNSDRIFHFSLFYSL